MPPLRLAPRYGYNLTKQGAGMMENSSESVAKPAARKLRWYQFSLRSLLVAVTLFGIACSWFAVKMGQANRQKKAVEVLLKSGGNVFYDYQYDASGSLTKAFFAGKATPPGPTWLRQWLGDDFFTNAVGLHPNRTTDADLEHLKDLPRLKAISLHSSKITDDGLNRIKALSQLETLDLQSTEITDAGLETLKEIPSLKSLCLFDTKITDAGLKNLQGLIELHYLILNDTEISDSGLEYTKGLIHLKVLRLDNTNVTDAGLPHLRGLSQLEFLYLRNTKVTDVGVENLHKALPKLKIERY
jgi:hypothetical protein